MQSFRLGCMSLFTGLMTDAASNLRCNPCVFLKLLSLEFMIHDGQLVFRTLERLRIEKQSSSLTNWVLANLFQIFICHHILLNIKNRDTLIHSLLQVLHSCPVHWSIIHSLRLGWQIYWVVVRTRVRFLLVAIFALKKVLYDCLLQIHCDWANQFSGINCYITTTQFSISIHWNLLIGKCFPWVNSALDQMGWSVWRKIASAKQQNLNASKRNLTCRYHLLVMVSTLNLIADFNI